MCLVIVWAERDKKDIFKMLFSSNQLGMFLVTYYLTFKPKLFDKPESN